MAKQPRYGLKYQANGLQDADYLDQLNDAEAEWLDRFVREFYRANFDKPGRKLHRKDQRREVYGTSNARRRDLWNQFSREFAPADFWPETEAVTQSPEDAIIDMIDGDSNWGKIDD